MTYERRQGNVVALVALIVTLLTNIIALTWGASKISFSIENLNKNTADLGSAVMNIQTTIQRMDVRMTIAETKIDGIKK